MQQRRQASDLHRAAAGTALDLDPAGFVDRVRAGDESAWRDLTAQIEPVLRWVARQYRLSPEDVADVVQLTWLRCLEHVDQLTHPDRLRAWLTTICRRESMLLATRKRREVPLYEPDAEQLTDDSGDPCAEVARRDEHDRLHRAITALPDRQRTVLVEVMGREGQSYLDLSRRLGVPMGSIGPTWQRAVIRLRRDPGLTRREYLAVS